MRICLLLLLLSGVISIQHHYYDGSSVIFDDLGPNKGTEKPHLEAGARPSVGALRWDAWNLYEGKYDPISFYTHKTMSPQLWQFRLPFFAQSLSSTNVSFNGDLQSVMDVEILYANHSGIDYWAFDTYCSYGPNCATGSTFCQQYSTQTSKNYCPRKPTYALDLYLASKYVNKIKFSLIMLGSPACDPNMQDSYIRYMKNAQFQTVMGGRPLLYLFQFDDQEAQACNAGWAGSRKTFDAFRAKVQRAGLKNPYIVLMDFDPSLTKSHATQLGLDAISSYALPGGSKTGSPFQQLHNNAMSYWSQSASTNFPMVPIAPTGWDPRPRAQNPPPFVNEGPEHYLQATGDDIQDLMISAVTWTCKNPKAAEAQTILVYAWNESSENGACLIPNLGNSTMYVEALSTVLPMQCPK